MAKTSSKRGWVLIILIIVAAVMYYQVTHKSNRENTVPDQLYQVEKTGAGVVIDYVDTAKRIHSKVDAALDKAKLKAENSEETDRKVPRSNVEGEIHWQTRSMLVKLPANIKIETWTQALADELKAVKGEILASEPDTYQEMAVTRIDAGVKDKLAGEELTLITDRIYIAQEKGEGAAEENAPAVPSQPSGTTKGVMAIIVDDFGYSSEPIEAFAAINRPLTFAVLPYKQFTNAAAARGVSSGHQVMLHLPMEPMSSGEQSEASTITVNMSDAEIRETTVNAIQTIPGLIGVNNHQGSRATADARVMKNVMQVIKANNLFFVDSRTNGASIAYQSAHQMGVRAGSNELFIDNQSDVGAIKDQIRKAMHVALNNGSVTIIGHARMNTARALRAMLPELDAAGVKLVFESQLVR